MAQRDDKRNLWQDPYSYRYAADTKSTLTDKVEKKQKKVNIKHGEGEKVKQIIWYQSMRML